MYTVKEIAEKMNLTEHTIRYYTDQGLVPSVKRDKNNNRLFDEEAANWLAAIKCLRECGMSIEAMKEYCELCLIGDETVEKRYQIILRQRAAAIKQLDEAEKRVKYLNTKVQRYEDIIGNKKPDIMNPGNWLADND